MNHGAGKCTLVFLALLLVPLSGCRGPAPEEPGASALGTASSALTELPACPGPETSVAYEADTLPENDPVNPWQPAATAGAVSFVQGGILHVEATGGAIAAWAREEPSLVEARSFSVAVNLQVDRPPPGTSLGGASVATFDGERLTLLQVVWTPDPATGAPVGELFFLTAGGLISHGPIDLSIQRRYQVEVSRSGDAVVRAEGIATPVFQVPYTSLAPSAGSPSFEVFQTENSHTHWDFVRYRICSPAPANNPPQASNDAFNLDEDSTLTVPSPGVLANDTDPDGDALTAVLVAGPAQGALTLSGDGSFVYIPEQDFNGTDTFTYEANDGTLASGAATVTLTVNPVNDAPVAQPQTVTTIATTALDILLSGSDIDDCELTFSIVSGPSNGTLTGVAGFPCTPGSSNPSPASTDTLLVTYTANLGFTGLDGFVFTVSDGQLTSAPAAVTIQVDPNLQIFVQTTVPPDFGQATLNGGAGETLQGFESLDGVIGQVTLQPQSGAAIVVSDTPQEVTLVSAFGGSATNVAAFVAPAGEYNGLSLDITNVTISLRGETHPVKVPSNRLKLNTQGGTFTVSEEGTTSVVVDLNIFEHLIANKNGFILGPVVLVDVTSRPPGDAPQPTPDPGTNAYTSLQQAYEARIAAIFPSLSVEEQGILEDEFAPTQGPALQTIWAQRGNVIFVNALELSIQVGGVSPEGTARAFFTQFGEVIGLPAGDNGTDLALTEVRDHPQNRFRVDFQQEHNSMPVRGAALRIHVSPTGDFLGLAGHYVPDIDVPANPTVSLAAAVTAYESSLPAGRTLDFDTNQQLVIYDPEAVAGLDGPPVLAWEFNAVLNAGPDQLAWVDATTGLVLGSVHRVQGSHALLEIEEPTLFAAALERLPGQLVYLERRQCQEFPSCPPDTCNIGCVPDWPNLGIAEDLLSSLRDVDDYWNSQLGREGWRGDDVAVSMRGAANYNFRNYNGIAFADRGCTARWVETWRGLPAETIAVGFDLLGRDALGTPFFCRDLVGHEWTHAVLTGEGAFGLATPETAIHRTSLVEGLADFFGKSAEHHATSVSSTLASWAIGTDCACLCDPARTSCTPLRDPGAPSGIVHSGTGVPHPDHYADFVSAQETFDPARANSTIISHLGAVLAQEPPGTPWSAGGFSSASIGASLTQGIFYAATLDITEAVGTFEEFGSMLRRDAFRDLRSRGELSRYGDVAAAIDGHGLWTPDFRVGASVAPIVSDRPVAEADFIFQSVPTQFVAYKTPTTDQACPTNCNSSVQFPEVRLRAGGCNPVTNPLCDRWLGFSCHAPAMKKHDGRLWVAWRDDVTGDLRVSSIGGFGNQFPTLPFSNPIEGRPSFGTLDGDLLIFWSEPSTRRMRFSVYQPASASWSTAISVYACEQNAFALSDVPPTAVEFRGFVYLFYVRDGKILYRIGGTPSGGAIVAPPFGQIPPKPFCALGLSSNLEWGSEREVPANPLPLAQPFTFQSPAATVHNGTIQVAVRDLASFAWINSCSGDCLEFGSDWHRWALQSGKVFFRPPTLTSRQGTELRMSYVSSRDECQVRFRSKQGR